MPMRNARLRLQCRSHPLPESLERVSEFQKHADHSRVFNKDLEMAWGCLLSLIARQPGGPTFQQGLSAAYYLVLQVGNH